RADDRLALSRGFETGLWVNHVVGVLDGLRAARMKRIQLYGGFDLKGDGSLRRGGGRGGPAPEGRGCGGGGGRGGGWAGGVARGRPARSEPGSGASAAIDSPQGSHLALPLLEADPSGKSRDRNRVAPLPRLGAERASILLRSLTVPGWGQASVGHRGAAKVFL